MFRSQDGDCGMEGVGGDAVTRRGLETGRGLAPGTLLFLQVSAGYMDVHFVKIHQAMHF